jgi:hypothetical protein
VSDSSADPNWVLKGPARPAQEFYKHPEWKPEPEEEDLLETHRGRLSQHEEGKRFLETLADLARGLHNISGKSREATALLKRGLQLDEEDMLVFLSLASSTPQTACLCRT